MALYRKKGNYALRAPHTRPGHGRVGLEELEEIMTRAPLHPMPQVAQAIQDLSRRLGVAATAIHVVEVEAVVWPDASLGCPQPGMVYAQVLTAGIRIRLRVGDAIYAYHGGGAHAPFLCKNPTPFARF